MNQTNQSTILRWILEKGLRTNKKQLIEFQDHYFLKDYLLDSCNRIVVRKCTQIGLSFTTLLKILYLADQENLSIVYTLPTAGDVKDFVLSKFDPIIESSKYLSSKVRKDPLSRRAVYSTVLKRIGGSHFFFRGSWSEHKAQSIDCDILAVDELDFQKPEIRAMYEERLKGSSSRDIIYWIGTPSLPNYGISELFEQSDQRYWYVRCPACNKEQTLEFPANISFRRKSYICKFCRHELSDQDRRAGRWIPKFPGREIHGYQFNRLMAPWIPASKIIEDYHREKPRHFYNFTLGLPFIEKSQQLRRERFEQSFMEESELKQFQKKKLICGVDQGTEFHLIAGYANSQEAVVIRAQRLAGSQELETVLDVIRPDLIVMDMFPDQHYARALQNKFGPYRCLLVNQRTYVNPAKLHELLGLRNREGVVSIERTEALDRTFDRINNTSVRFLKSMQNLEEVFRHLQNLVPDIQERFGRKKKIYKSVGPDDYAFALNFFLLGTEILFPGTGGRPMRIIPSVIASPDELPGSSEWFQKDFEKRIREVSGNPDVIIIPPKLP